jgi:predicted GNAT family acetyltransferase
MADEPDPIASELDLPAPDMDDEVVVVHDPERGRYRALLGERQVAVMHATGEDGVVTITAVIVDATLRGRGLATDLIAHVLDELRDAGSKVIPECPEVVRFIEHHPEYADLVAAS